MGKQLREFDEWTPKWRKRDEKPSPRQIIASPQFITKATKERFKKGLDSFLDDLEQLMIGNDIGFIYLGLGDWYVMYND